jgi:hypothetical protein
MDQQRRDVAAFNQQEEDMPTLDELGTRIDATLRVIHDTLTPGVTRLTFDGDQWANVTDTRARVVGMETTLRGLTEVRADDLDVEDLPTEVDVVVREAMASVVQVQIPAAAGRPTA